MKTIEEYKLAYALTDVVVPADEAEIIVYDLIAEAANDKNSSKFREDVTKIMVGLRPSEGKLGYDDDFEAIEVKPVNYTGRKTSKLDGKGSFSDFTWARHKKYMNDGVRMLISGFDRGKLLFIIEFPYASLQTRIEEILQRKLPNGDISGTYVRTTGFNYIHWSQHPYTIKFVRSNIDEYSSIFNKKFFKLLK